MAGRRPPHETVDAVVVGGGMTGLAAADSLSSRGLSVRLVEGGPAVGGLARSVVVGGEEIEAYYHHAFPQDRELRDLVERLGLRSDLEWLRASTAVLDGGRVYPFNSVLDLLRFGPLSRWGRLRLGLGSAVALVSGRGRAVDRKRVGDSGPRWFGRRGYEVLWRPLLESKFGPLAGDVALAWLAARMRQRAGSRKTGRGDRLGYLRGGMGRLARVYGQAIEAAGVDVSTGVNARSIRRRGANWRVDTSAGPVDARAVVAALSGDALKGLVDLPDPYASRIAAIPYRGVVCALLELGRPLGRHYWTNLTQRTDLDCLAVIEHTNFIPAARYGGRHLIYLAHYADVGDRAWAADSDELVAAAGGVLRAVNPDFDPSWIAAAHLTRDRWAQPVPLAGGPMPGLPLETGLDGLFHASLAHIYPDDRGVSLALRLGRRAGEAAADWLSRPGEAL